jgi:hypothetical protein
MKNTLNDSLKVILPYLNTNLVSFNSFSCITEVASFLPGFPTVSDVIFECTLGDDVAKADFSVCLTTLNRGREIMANSNCIEGLPKINFTNPVWNRIHNFCLNWADQASPLYENVDNIWLEFDIDKLSQQVPVPSLFFGPKSRKAFESNPATSKVDFHSNCWVTEAALKPLFSFPLSSQIKRNIKACFDLLPSDAEIFQIGVMLPRKSEYHVVRVCVKNIYPEQILPYLISIGYEYSISDIRKLVDKLSGIVDFICLNFAVNDTILPKIGFECYFRQQPMNEPRWKLFFDYLVSNLNCNPKKTNALLNWAGYSDKQVNEKLWPSNISTTSNLISPRAFSVFLRTLNHIKIVYQPEDNIQAKAYLWFGHRWLSPNKFKQLKAGGKIQISYNSHRY